MTTSPAHDRPTLLELEEMLARLRAERFSGRHQIGGGTISSDGKGTSWGGERIMEQVNPDGNAAADVIELLLADLKAARAGLEPFARAYATFDFALGPDGIDDHLVVIAKTVARPDHEAKLSTVDFFNARATLAAMTTADQGGEWMSGKLPARPDDWIDWNGGECPVPPDTIVRLKCRSGFVSAYHTAGERHLQKLWRHDLRHSPGNISAYKVFSRDGEARPADIAEPPPGDPQ